MLGLWQRGWLGTPIRSDEGLGRGHNMKDIDGEEFQVGDTLKVIKVLACDMELQVGDVVECIYDDKSTVCEFRSLSNGKSSYYYNDHLQKL